MNDFLRLTSHLGKILQKRQQNKNITQASDVRSEDDGKTHIRIDTRSVTSLGIYLGNRYDGMDFFIPELNKKFTTGEGMWQYISYDKRIEEFADIDGHNCVKLARFISREDLCAKPKQDSFRQIIGLSYWYKILQNEDLLIRFYYNKLPYKFYYFKMYKGKVVYNANNEISIITDDKRNWLCESLDLMANYLRANYELDDLKAMSINERNALPKPVHLTVPAYVFDMLNNRPILEKECYIKALK